jgi:hypothetical protein
MTDLIKAADALADFCDELKLLPIKQAQLTDRLTAYRQARESSDGVNVDDLFKSVEDILYDCIVSIQGEVSGLEEAYDRITSRIKAALEETK